MDCVPLPVDDVPKPNKADDDRTYRDEDRCQVSRCVQSRASNGLQEILFSDLDPVSDPLPTVCSSDGNIIDETKSTRRVFPTVMARGSNSDESTPWRSGTIRDG